MAARRTNPKHARRHEWHSYEDYRLVNEKKLGSYHYIEDSEVAFVEIHDEGDLFIRMDATVWLPQSVVLEVSKFFETMRKGPGKGKLYVRGLFYRYNASVQGKHNILRYDNLDDPKDYHGHWFDKNSGKETERRSMTRDDFPLFSEVIEEVDAIMGFSNRREGCTSSSRRGPAPSSEDEV